jgi:predicted ATPase
LAALGLLSEAAAERPLLCLVDDAQWLDAASLNALTFVARRLAADSVGLLFAVRQTSDDAALAGLPELVLDGLSDDHARALLQSALPGPLDARVRDRIVAETRGNPLALLELPRGLTSAELAGGFGILGARGLSARIEESFVRRLTRLPPDTRRLLLIAAVESTGEPRLVWRAAARVGIDTEAADAAAADELVEFGARVSFRHPLVRSAVYRSAAATERRAAHLALAEVIDATVDPDRRAWHLAAATPDLDEAVAAELERSAGRAQARGGLAAAAAFLERSCELTLDPAQRARRALAAADAKARAGAFEAALGLLDAAESRGLDELGCAQAERLRGQIGSALRVGDEGPSRLLLMAAKRLERLDPNLARETYLEALASVYGTRSAAHDAGIAAAAPPAPQPPRAIDLLLDGQVLLYTQGYAAAAGTLKRATEAFCGESDEAERSFQWLTHACHMALMLWDDAGVELLTRRQVDRAAPRERSACCRSRSPNAPACSCSRPISTRQRRRSRR